MIHLTGRGIDNTILSGDLDADGTPDARCLFMASVPDGATVRNSRSLLIHAASASSICRNRRSSPRTLGVTQHAPPFHTFGHHCCGRECHGHVGTRAPVGSYLVAVCASAGDGSKTSVLTALSLR
jgi:hypothetical protein